MDNAITNQDHEMHDLRNAPYKDTRGDQLAYSDASAFSMTTTALPKGTQARFICVARLAARYGYPLNTMITIAWDRLFASREVKKLRTMTAPKRIDHIVELLRHWLTNREVPPLYIWVREHVRNEGEHLHIGFHLPSKWRHDLAQQVTAWTEEAPWPGRHPRATKGEFACGECRSWHLARDIAPRLQGFCLAAYLGKGEPSQVMFRGKLMNNLEKPVRGTNYGGTERTGKYDADQGRIVGTKCRRDRFFISKALKSLEKEQKKSVREAQSTCGSLATYLGLLQEHTQNVAF